MTAEGSRTRRRTAASGSVLAVATGLAVYGGASFVFLAIAGRALGDSPGYTALALTWTLLNAVGIGLYMPAEQEGGRAIAGRIALAGTDFRATLTGNNVPGGGDRDGWGSLRV